MNQKNIPLPDARVWVNIDTEALRHNFRQLRKKAAIMEAHRRDVTRLFMAPNK